MSSLPLQVLIDVDNWYFWLYWTATLYLLIYKANSYAYYPTLSLVLETLAVLSLPLVHTGRRFLGSRGNKCEEAAPLLLFNLLNVVCFVAVLFFCLWQSFVTMADLVFSGIWGGMVLLELLFGFWTWVSLLQ